MAKLTTHILDTAHGRPAGDVAVRLYRLLADKELLADVRTNADGRTDAPLLKDAEMASGSYELEFDVGDYFQLSGVEVGTPAFLDTVVIRFSVNANEHFHVPLLVSPWSYSTYRGS